jgi:hypothetical protein
MPFKTHWAQRCQIGRLTHARRRSLGNDCCIRHQRVTVRTADLVTPAVVPEMVTLLVVRTALVVTVKVAVVAPGATVTLGGTAATFDLLLES